MVSMQDLGLSPGSSPHRGLLCGVVFLGKTLHSHSPLSTGVLMAISKLPGKPGKMLGATCDGLASRPGEVAILLAA